MRDGVESDLPPYSLIQEQTTGGTHTKAWLLAAHLTAEGTALANLRIKPTVRALTRACTLRVPHRRPTLVTQCAGDSPRRHEANAISQRHVPR